jgi:recombination protein RecR
LTVDALVSRAAKGGIKEIILALPASMEGDTTAFYLAKRLVDSECMLTTLARGVSVGEALQYADEATLSSSLLNRLPYKG